MADGASSPQTTPVGPTPAGQAPAAQPSQQQLPSESGMSRFASVALPAAAVIGTALSPRWGGSVVNAGANALQAVQGFQDWRNQTAREQAAEAQRRQQGLTLDDVLKASEVSGADTIPVPRPRESFTLDAGAPRPDAFGIGQAPDEPQQGLDLGARAPEMPPLDFSAPPAASPVDPALAGALRGLSASTSPGQAFEALTGELLSQAGHGRRMEAMGQQQRGAREQLTQQQQGYTIRDIAQGEIARSQAELIHNQRLQQIAAQREAQKNTARTKAALRQTRLTPGDAVIDAQGNIIGSRPQEAGAARSNPMVKVQLDQFNNAQKQMQALQKAGFSPESPQYQEWARVAGFHMEQLRELGVEMPPGAAATGEPPEGMSQELYEQARRELEELVR